MSRSTASSLAAEFQPAGNHPEWWPGDAMRSITPFPVDWVRIVELTPVFHDGADGGIAA